MAKKLIIADAEQIEARITKWLAALTFNRREDWDALEKIRNGMSIYEVYARAALDWTGGDLKKEDPEEYFNAKQCVLSLGFQCGWKKYKKRMADFGRNLSVVTAKDHVYTYRGNEQGIVKLWNSMDENFRDDADHKREAHVVELPSGFALTYLKPDKYTFNWGVEYGAIIQQAISPRIARLYGGAILENAVQSIARDLFADRMLTAERSPLAVETLFTSHDEIIFEADDSVDPLDVKQILEDNQPTWTEGLPVSWHVIESKHYKK